MISVICCIIVFLTGSWNPKLHVHPYKLVTLIALIDAIYFLCFNTIEETCNFHLEWIWAATVYFDTSVESRVYSL